VPARIAPLPPEDWPEAMGEALAALRPKDPRHPLPSREPGRPKGLHILGTLARHPSLATAFHTLTGHVLFATTLSPRQRELVVLRVAAVRQSEYEWLQHLVLADDAGLDPEEVDRVAIGPTAAGWSDLDAALLRATDELVAGARISDDTWTTLSSALDEQQLMDVVFTVGTYDLLAMAIGAFDIEVDDDLRDWKRASR
jgi:alkylhydroperoxidase family enzyme